MDINELIRGSVKRAPNAPVSVTNQPVTLGTAKRSLVPVGAWRSDPLPTRVMQGATRRDTSVPTITRTPSQMQGVSRQLGQPTARTQLPTARGSATSSFVTQLSQSAISRIPPSAGGSMGSTMPPPPTGRSVVSPVLGDRAGILPPSTLSTQGAFGGESGGMGAAAAAGAAAPASGAAADLGLGGIGESISSIGNSIVDTVKEYLPLAIKVILAVIIIKIVLWLLRGRR